MTRSERSRGITAAEAAAELLRRDQLCREFLGPAMLRLADGTLLTSWEAQKQSAFFRVAVEGWIEDEARYGREVSQGEVMAMIETCFPGAVIVAAGHA